MNRRTFLATSAATLAGCRARTSPMPVSTHAMPSPAQLQWQRDELAMFLHFGVNTFTDREWGDGTEDTRIFAPANLDARQWARAARAAGFRAMILTAKHHDGFCLWPTRTTTHSVASSGWKNGQGDVVREFVDACRAESLRPGLYLSPWDRNSAVYGDSPRYNDFYCDQLTELLTHYGEIAEVWFDGANGEGPNGRKQVYDWPRFWGTVRRLQPNAVIFSDAGPDIRWIGNERGLASETNWSPVDPSVVPYPGASGDAVMQMLQHGDPHGTVWRPGETDVSIRPGWFYHAAENTRVRSVDNLVDLYFTSVGRNSKLLLNVPPARDGLLHDIDVARLAAFRARLDALFANPVTHGTEQFVFDAPTPVSIVDLREDISAGQRISRYSLDWWDGSQWRALASGTTIGCRRLHRVQDVKARRVRLLIEDAVDTPTRPTVALYA